jgi:hypothetical protein
VSVRFGSLLIQWRKLFDPVENSRGIHWEVPLGEPLAALGLAESETQVPAHRPTDDRGRKGRAEKEVPVRAVKERRQSAPR